ncbi:hypothetical protein SDC9_136993 [bioreactor metagenome]|uniref:Uncharacterized protein n=1 Tax=bioreactor metagenome TaxID=1076179 RepID=A0A645DLC2_9ZZZZ
MQAAQVHFDELGQVRRHARHVQFVHQHGHQALVDLHCGGLFSTLVVDRHLHVQLGLGVHALEVNVQNQLLEGVELHVAQQHLGSLAVDFHVQHGSVEGFLLQGVPQVVVVQLDQLGLAFTTVDDTGRAARNTQTAARTRALLGALKSDKFHN